MLKKNLSPNLNPKNFIKRCAITTYLGYTAQRSFRYYRMVSSVKLNLFSSSRAITRAQAIAAVLVIVIAAVGGIWYYTQSAPAPFSMEVISRPTIPMKREEENLLSIVGQRVVFLVVVEDTGKGHGHGEAIDISAFAPGAEVSVNNPTIKSGEFAEVTVIPDQMSTNKILTLTISGRRSGLEQKETVTIEVMEGEDDLGALAAEMRDKFIPWLATNRPEFGITSETEWIGTVVNPGILVVMHYIFYSNDWEMYVTWHVMIPPHDWVKIYLRFRFTETHPSYAFEISSVQGEEEPHSIEVPDWV